MSRRVATITLNPAYDLVGFCPEIERGEVNLTVDKLYQIALILKCEAAELLPPHEQLT